MLEHKIYGIYVIFKKNKCHNRLIYNFLNRVTVYVKSEELYRSQNTKTIAGIGEVKKKIWKVSKKLENWKVMSIKAKPKTIKNTSRSLIFKKEHRLKPTILNIIIH